MANQKPNVLLVDPFFGSFGGGVMVTCWMAQALSDTCNVSWLSWRGFDLDRLNRLTGTSLTPGNLTQLCAPKALQVCGNVINAVDPDGYSIQRWSLLMRYLRSIAPRFDLTITCNDETDMGSPGIQYVHFPYLKDSIAPQDDGSFAFHPEVARRPWVWSSGFDPNRFRANRTLTNSDWTGAMTADAYQIETSTLYPPAPGDFAPRPWSERENAVICVGRLSDDKRIDWIFEIVRHARAADPDLRLHIAGVPYTGPGGEKGMSQIREFASENEWVDLHIDLPRQDLVDLMCRCRYGVHAKKDEHFGISVAEMVRAGAVVLVHQSGGQVEIVGSDPRLTYTDARDGTEKLSAVIKDDHLRSEVLSLLAEQAEAFTTDRFCSGIRSIVSEELAARGIRG